MVIDELEFERGQNSSTIETSFIPLSHVLRSSGACAKMRIHDFIYPFLGTARIAEFGGLSPISDKGRITV